MSAELAIITGLGLISVMFGYYTRIFKESTEELNNKLSILFFFFSLLFLNLVMYAILLIGQNTVGLTYLSNSVLNTGLLVMTYSTVGFLIIYFIILFVLTVISGGNFVLDYYKGRGK